MTAKLVELRTELKKRADKGHAAFHKGYHKSSKDFYGLKNASLVEAVNEVFPKRDKLETEEVIPSVTELWASNWFEEQHAGLLLLERAAKQLTPKHLPFIRKMFDECEGWATTDYLATKMLGIMAMNYPDEVYPKVRKWSQSKHLWTRRASILVHILPSRIKQLDARYALPTFTELLGEKEFFIRKAIGWTLREMCKHYPEMVEEYLREHRSEMSGLTYREAGRNLGKK